MPFDIKKTICSLPKANISTSVYLIPKCLYDLHINASLQFSEYKFQLMEFSLSLSPELQAIAPLVIIPACSLSHYLPVH